MKYKRSKSMRELQLSVASILLGSICLVIAMFTIPSCSSSLSMTPVDKVIYSSNAPQILHNATTQASDVSTQQKNDMSAGDHVLAAQVNVQAVNKDKPDTRLSSADQDLTTANSLLKTNVAADEKTIASLNQSISDLRTHITADTALKAQADQLAIDKAAATDSAVKDEAFIKYHENDVWGAWTHKVVADISWTLIITFFVLLIGVGIIGSIYGLPRITQPAATFFGMVISVGQVVLYHAATFIWACFLGFGHYIDEALNELGLHKRAATVTQVVTPKPLTTISAAVSPEATATAQNIVMSS